MKTLLFVCTANICRSPMAGAIFNALAEDGGLPFRTESAGAAAPEGRAVAPNAAVAFEEPGGSTRAPMAPDGWARRCSKDPSWCSG